MIRFLTDPPAIAAAAAGTVFALCAVAVLVKVLCSAAKGARPGAARAVQVLALSVTMSYSGLTSWQWATTRLNAPVWERGIVFAAFEVVMLAFAVASRENRLKDGRSGWQHGATLFFAGLMSLMALQVAGSPLVAAVRFGGGPLAALLLFHSLLGLELRHQGTERESLLRSALQEVRERITARLGIGRRGADSAAIARSRAADRAVRLASARKLSQRAADRLAVAIDAAQHGLDAADARAAEASIVARVVRRKSVAGLHGITVRQVWTTGPDAPQAAGGPTLYPAAHRSVLPAFGAFSGPFNRQAAPFSAPVNTLPNPGPVDPAENAKQMRDQGLSYGVIADRLGRSKSWVHGAVNGTIPAANSHQKP